MGEEDDNDFVWRATPPASGFWAVGWIATKQRKGPVRIWRWLRPGTGAEELDWTVNGTALTHSEGWGGIYRGEMAQTVNR